ncbi:MAG: helix-turn-helix transcriptional regulator [Lachnospiraceae bacterium]|nr:helix-turn-helix transcriptional regulator [Lachnospiraceae bacterium]
MAFGDILLELLEERDISQKDFANMLNIAKTTLNGYIKNKHEPDFETVKAMASALHVSTDLLLGYESALSLTSKELQLIERIRRMDIEQQNIFFDLAMITDKRMNQKFSIKIP